MKHKYCIACGMPGGKVCGIALHPGPMGNSCQQSKFFLECVCADADKAGIAPHLHLKRLLDDKQLLPSYAVFAEPRKRQRESEEVQDKESQQPTQQKTRKRCTIQ